MLESSENTVLILDRGFVAFKAAFENQQDMNAAFYPNVRIKIPAHQNQPGRNQYSQQDADKSRLGVNTYIFYGNTTYN